MSLMRPSAKPLDGRRRIEVAACVSRTPRPPRTSGLSPDPMTIPFTTFASGIAISAARCGESCRLRERTGPEEVSGGAAIGSGGTPGRILRAGTAPLLHRPDGDKAGVELATLRSVSLRRQDGHDSVDGKARYFWDFGRPQIVVSTPFFSVEPSIVTGILERELADFDEVKAMRMSTTFSRNEAGFLPVVGLRGVSEGNPHEQGRGMQAVNISVPNEEPAGGGLSILRTVLSESGECDGMAS